MDTDKNEIFKAELETTFKTVASFRKKNKLTNLETSAKAFESDIRDALSILRTDAENKTQSEKDCYC